MNIQKEDCKFMNMLNRIFVEDKVYQDLKEKEDIDFYKYLAVGEGEASKNYNQPRERIVRELKYFQVRRAVTDQMKRVHGLEDAYVSEKIAGTLQILMDAEYMCFQGNEDINPLEFDGILRQIEKSKNPKNRICAN